MKTEIMRLLNCSENKGVPNSLIKHFWSTDSFNQNKMQHFHSVHAKGICKLKNDIT